MLIGAVDIYSKELIPIDVGETEEICGYYIIINNYPIKTLENIVGIFAIANNERTDIENEELKKKIFSAIVKNKR